MNASPAPARRVALVLLGLLLGSSGVAAREETPADAPARLIRAGRVVPLTGPVLEPGEVLVADGKIVAVGRGLARPEGAELLDLGPDGTLLPGFVDARGPSSALAGGSDEYTREITPGFHAATVLDPRHPAFAPLRDEGVTTTAVSPGTENVIAGSCCVLKTAGARLLRADAGLVLSLCEDPQRRNSARSRPDGIYVRQPTNRMGTVWLLRSAFDRAREGQEVEGADRLRAALQGELRPFVVSRSESDLHSLLNLRAEFGLQPVAVEAREAHRVAGLLAEAGVPVVLDPMNTGLDQGRDETPPCWARAALLAEAGVDFAFSGGRLLEQARLAHRFGLPAERALEALSLAPARMLGIDGQVGSIQPGRDADLVALDGAPLEFGTATRWVMVDGVIHPQRERQTP